MKIVVLDGFTLNPGDFSWESLNELGELTIHDRTAPSDVLRRAEGAEALLTNKTVLSAETINSLPDLKYIGVLATGGRCSSGKETGNCSNQYSSL